MAEQNELEYFQNLANKDLNQSFSNSMGVSGEEPEYEEDEELQEEDDSEINYYKKLAESVDPELLESLPDSDASYVPDEQGDEHTLPNNNVGSVENDDANKKSVLGAIGEVGSLIKDAMFGETSIAGKTGEDFYEGGFFNTERIHPDFDETKLTGIVGSAIPRGVITGYAETVKTTANVTDIVLRGANPTTGRTMGMMFVNMALDGEPKFKLYEKIAREGSPEYFETVDKVMETFALKKLAHNIEKFRDRKFAVSDSSISFAATEGLSQFFGTYGLLSVFSKATRGLKGKYLNEAITGFFAFNEEDKNITDVVKDLGVHIPIITDLLAKDEDDSYFMKKIKNFTEPVGIAMAFDSGKIVDNVVKIHKYRNAIDAAKKDLLQYGEVPDETRKLLEQTAKEVGEIEPIDIKGEVKKDLLKKAASMSDRIKKVRGATRANKQKQIDDNAIEAQKNVEMNNQIIEDMEAKLSVNNGLERTDASFVRVSKKVFGRRVLDTKLLRKAKNMEARPTVARQLAEGVTEAGEDSVDDLLGDATSLATKDSQRSIDDLYNKTLTPENIDALTVVFSEMRKKRPDLWNDKKPPMRAAFDMVVKLSDEGNPMDFIKDHPLYDALNKAGMSFEDFTVNGLGAASEAGQILRSFRNIKESYSTKALKAEYEMKELMNRQGSVAKFMRRVENIRRGGLVSQIATASRNLTSGLIRAPVEAINNIVETAVYDLSRGNFASNRILKRTTWQDSFAHMKYIFKDRKTAKEFTDFLTEQPELQQFHDQMFNTINEIQVHTGRGSGSGVDAILSKGEDFVQMLNTPNRWQDFMLRRAMFLGEAKRLFRQEWDIDLLEELDNGRIKDILKDSDDLNPTNGRRPALDIFAEATQRALDLTYASAPEIALNRNMANFIVRNNFTVVLPFPRFMFKSMELMAENSGGIFVPVANKIFNAPIRRMRVQKAIDKLKAKPKDSRSVQESRRLKTLEDGLADLKKGKNELSIRESRAIARNVTGASAIGAAMWMLGDEDQGEDYKFIPDGQGNVIDTTPLFPLRQFLFLGKITRDWVQASEDIGGIEAGKEAFFNAFPAREWAETFLGTNFRLGVGGNLLDEAAKMFTSQDLTAGERLSQEAGETLGEYLSSFLVPLNQIIDAQRALGTRGLEYKEMANDPNIYPENRFMAGLGKSFKRYALDPSVEGAAPVKEDPLQDLRKRVNIGAKVIGGINMYTQDSEEGRFLKSLGFTKWDLSSKSRIPSVKNFENEMIRTYLPDIVEYIKDRKAGYEQEYEDKRETLSTGRNPVSKKRYVKIRLKQDVDSEINFFRNNPDEISVALVDKYGVDEGVDKAIKIDAMVRYRRLTQDQRNEAAVIFRQETNREPDLEYTEEDLRELIPDYDNYSKEQQAKEVNDLKLEDLYHLSTIADKFKR